MTLFLVRHGRPVPRPGESAHRWELDPAGFDEVWTLRESGTAWTVLVAALTGAAPDLGRWRTLALPDLIVVPG